MFLEAIYMLRRNRRPGFGQGRRPLGRGLQNGSEEGFRNGGLGRNRTDDCRHPELKKQQKK